MTAAGRSAMTTSNAVSLMQQACADLEPMSSVIARVLDLPLDWRAAGEVREAVTAIVSAAAHLRQAVAQFEAPAEPF